MSISSVPSTAALICDDGVPEVYNQNSWCLVIHSSLEAYMPNNTTPFLLDNRRIFGSQHVLFWFPCSGNLAAYELRGTFGCSRLSQIEMPKGLQRSESPPPLVLIHPPLEPEPILHASPTTLDLLQATSSLLLFL